MNRNGATSVIFNVTGSSVTFNQGNFTGNDLTSPWFSANGLFNFYQATNVEIDNLLYGALLAPGASLLNKTAIEGSVFVKDFNQQGEVHVPSYAGYLAVVPEPSSLLLMAPGLPILGLGPTPSPPGKGERLSDPTSFRPRDDACAWR